MSSGFIAPHKHARCGECFGEADAETARCPDCCAQMEADAAAALRAAFEEGARSVLERLASDLRRHADANRVRRFVLEGEPAPLFEAIEEATGFVFPNGTEFMCGEDIAEGIARYIERFAAPIESETRDGD